MRGEVLFEKMTGISDEYITEAALVPALGASSAQKPESRFAALSRVLNSGWGVACICFIVAIAAVVGMVAWGRMGTAGPGPVGPGSDPSVRFAFSFEMTSNDGSAWTGMASPGDVVTVNTSIVNHGKSFTGYGFFAHAQFVHQEDETVILEGHYPVADAAPITVENGQKGSRTFHFHIPENATPGVYDLVLSYDGEKQVFGGALTVGDPTEESKPPYGTNDLYAFSFGYEPYGGDPLVNSFLHLETWVRNDSEPFTFTGSSMGFAPHAVLLHRETGYRIEGMFDATTDYTEVTVNKGDIGRVNQEFFIPADAPTGIYDLVLSFYGATQTFENVLTVSIPIQEEDHRFSFGYESLEGFAIPGDWLTAKAWVINEGEPFSFVGDPYSFQPTATLYHTETGYVIQGYPAPTGVMSRPCNILTGQKGANSYEFRIPVDAPTGEYGLRLSYHGQEQSFEGVLTVATP